MENKIIVPINKDELCSTCGHKACEHEARYKQGKYIDEVIFKGECMSRIKKGVAKYICSCKEFKK